MNKLYRHWLNWWFQFVCVVLCVCEFLFFLARSRIELCLIWAKSRTHFLHIWGDCVVTWPLIQNRFAWNSQIVSVFFATLKVCVFLFSPKKKIWLKFGNANELKWPTENFREQKSMDPSENKALCCGKCHEISSDNQFLRCKLQTNTLNTIDWYTVELWHVTGAVKRSAVRGIWNSNFRVRAFLWPLTATDYH